MKTYTRHANEDQEKPILSFMNENYIPFLARKTNRYHLVF